MGLPFLGDPPMKLSNRPPRPEEFEEACLAVSDEIWGSALALVTERLGAHLPLGFTAKCLFPHAASWVLLLLNRFTNTRRGPEATKDLRCLLEVAKLVTCLAASVVARAI
mmetsp:Transcript_11602/g.42434  ORF Transcript_11602/g.42434 Transcript_11602/m.42434 type:complete len:110 (-) Transcript_11602:244-573(-)